MLFTLTYATWAAKSERAGKFLVPLLDILQSVPILGFISITVVFFMSLAPGRVLGAEFVQRLGILLVGGVDRRRHSGGRAGSPLPRLHLVAGAEPRRQQHRRNCGIDPRG